MSVADLSVLRRPFSLKSLNLKNRIVMAPMTRTRSPGGIPNADNAAYYRRRAEHDVGLIITEGTTVNHPGANAYEGVPSFHGAALEGWKTVVDEVHAAGGAIIPQLWHVGAVRRPGVGPYRDAPAYNPSGLFMPGREAGKAMTDEDIADVIAAFAQGARDAERLGFDGVEVHGAHGYLLDQFNWEGLNQRSDRYGGNLENRLRFTREVVQAVRAAVSDNFAVVVRLSQWKQQDYSARVVENPEQMALWLGGLVDAGADIFHCSTRRFWEPEFDGSALNFAGWAKKLAGKPTISVGSVGLTEDFIGPKGMASAEKAELRGIDDLLERMAADEFDLIALGRVLLQDPAWWAKVRAGQLDQLQPYHVSAMQRYY